MKIRRYEGKNETQVIERIKNELGSQALILNIRKIQPKGFFSFFRKATVEITVGIDDKSKRLEQAEQYTRKEEQKQEEKENLRKEEQKQEELKEQLKREEFKKEEERKAELEAQKEEKIKEQERIIKMLEAKLDNLEVLLTNVNQKILNNNNNVESRNGDKKYNNNVLQLFYNNLIKNEVLPEIAKEILDDLDKEENNDVNKLVRIVYTRIIEILGKSQPIEFKENDEKSKLIAFIGPTGVGKTTTIAKVIARFILDKDKKVGLITADTYRIAAVEQLKTYAEILGISLDVLYSTEELQDKLKQHEDKDLLFLDTAGRSHKNEQQFKELENLLSQIEEKEVLLVLSLTTKYKDIIQIIQKYSSILSEYKIIFTKMDETLALGTILNVRKLTNKPISYITFGQDVPDDIELMNSEKIAKLLLGSFDE